MQILEITERPGITDKVGIHILISVAAFITTYAWLLFGGEGEEFIFFLDHTQLTLVLCLTVLFLANVILFMNGMKKHHLVGLKYVEVSKSLEFELINKYSKKTRQAAYSLSDIYWVEKEKSILGLGIEAKNVVLFKLNSGKTIARIDPSLNPWSWKRKEIMKAMNNLEKINKA